MTPIKLPNPRPLLTRTGLIIGALLVVMGTMAMAGAATAVTSYQWSPVHAGDFPDPSVMLYGGTYYGFATQNFAAPNQTINIQISASSDGVNWTASTTDALPNLPSWAKRGNTWAPSVAYDAIDHQFVMYYTATQSSNGDQCIGRAVASTPEGPYVDQSTIPVVCQDGVDNGSLNYGGSIDPDIFTDNGVSTLIWKSDGNHIGISTYIWSQPLSSNLMTLNGSPTPILTSDDGQAWNNGIIEGPSMVDHNGTDYLFYSGGDEGSANYAIGFAVCSKGPSAACAEGASNPILTSAPGMSGPGGPSAFLSPSGALDIAFAAWEGNTVGYLNCGIRPMYLSTVTFNSGVPSLSPATSGGSVSSPACAPPPPPPPKPGYWQVAADGGIFTFGSAKFHGSTGSLRLNRPVVGMASTHDGKGYWLVASDGGIFAFGDAQFYGSTGGRSIYYPITAMAPAFLGGGYWLVDANGDVFSFGDANYYGQPPYAPGGYRITGMAGNVNSGGYWLASANGNVANYGDAPNYGSPVRAGVNGSIVGIASTVDSAGYWLQGSDGGIFSYGDAVFEGSMGGQHLNAPMVGIASESS